MSVPIRHPLRSFAVAGGGVPMQAGAYSRNPAGKQPCLEVLAEVAIDFPTLRRSRLMSDEKT